MTSGKLLRITRVALAILFFAGVNFYLVSGLLSLGWVEHIQIIPAIMAHGLTVVALWAVLTLFLGRVYCSTVCPLGTVQDFFARLPRIFKRMDYHYSRPLNLLRYFFLVITAVIFAGHLYFLLVPLDPYTAYVYAARPIIEFLFGDGRPLLAGTSLIGSTVGVAVVLGAGLTAAKNGRTVCNTVCPVGAALSVVSRRPYMVIDINTDRCIHCRKCEEACKSHCIDMNSMTVDMSRCVVCFDCLPVCPNDAIHYTPNRHQLSIPMMQRISRPAATASMDEPC